MDYGKASRIIRAARAVSQLELAQRVSCSPSTISFIESGQRQPSLAMAQKIARALSVPFDLFTVLASTTREDCDMSPTDAEFIGCKLLSILMDDED